MFLPLPLPHKQDVLLPVVELATPSLGIPSSLTPNIICSMSTPEMMHFGPLKFILVFSLFCRFKDPTIPQSVCPIQPISSLVLYKRCVKLFLATSSLRTSPSQMVVCVILRTALDLAQFKATVFTLSDFAVFNNDRFGGWSAAPNVRLLHAVRVCACFVVVVVVFALFVSCECF